MLHCNSSCFFVFFKLIFKSQWPPHSCHTGMRGQNLASRTILCCHWHWGQRSSLSFVGERSNCHFILILNSIEDVREPTECKANEMWKRGGDLCQHLSRRGRNSGRKESRLKASLTGRWNVSPSAGRNTNRTLSRRRRPHVQTSAELFVLRP